MSDYYKILGISKGASQDDIKSAYKRLARTHHPDRGGDKEKFQNIQEAYETLSDSNKRQKYDSPQDDLFPFAFDHPFFNQNQHQHHHQQQKKQIIKKADHLYTCKITLRDVFYGTIKKLKVQRSQVCKACINDCNNCGGNGIITKHVQMGPFTQVVQQTCSNCNGSGKTSNSNNCIDCKSSGVIQEENIFEIIIKPGIYNGKKFIFDGWGEQPIRSNETAGSFIVSISIDTDPNFTRSGLDLHYTITLSYRESIIGKDVIIPHFKEAIHLDTRGFGIINPNKNYILYDRGLINESGTVGNMQIKFIINYPERTFNDEELVTLKKVFDSINLE